MRPRMGHPGQAGENPALCRNCNARPGEARKPASSEPMILRAKGVGVMVLIT